MASDAIMGFATVGLETLDGRTAEGIAPLEGRGPSSFVLPYDNTSGFTTGAAFVNLSAAAATITISTLDDRGTELDVQAITLPANGRGSFDSDDQIPITIGRRGIIKLRNVSGGGLAGLGFRFSPFGTFTYIPVLTQR
jgi:hypothetical protein